MRSETCSEKPFKCIARLSLSNSIIFALTCLFLHSGIVATHAQSELWGKSPKEYYDIIGNAKYYDMDQGIAYTQLKEYAKPKGEALFWLAACYIQGKTGEGGPTYARNKKGFPPHRPEAYQLALPLLIESAKQGFLPSISLLATLFDDGEHVERNPDARLHWLSEGVRLGDKGSYVSLTKLFEAGFPEATDEESKAQAIKALSDRGLEEASIDYAKLLLRSNQDKNEIQAKALLNSLVDKGSQKAKEILEEIAAVERQQSENAQAEAKRIELQRIAAEKADLDAKAKAQQDALDLARSIENAQLEAEKEARDPDRMFQASTIKIKGLFIGMSIDTIEEWCTERLESLPTFSFKRLVNASEGIQIFIIHNKNIIEQVEQSIKSSDANPSTAFIAFLQNIQSTQPSFILSKNGQVTEVDLNPDLVNALFDSESMDAATFAQEIVNAYDIPTLKVEQDQSNLFAKPKWAYTSDEGFRVVVHQTKRIELSKVASVQERRSKFD